MPRTDGKTIFHKLFVFAKYRSFDNFITAICIIIKQGMPDIFHMHPYLVCAAGFKNTLNQSNVTKSFYNFIMSNSLFSILAFGVRFKYFSVSLMTADMRNDRSLVVFHITPNQSNVLPFNTVFIKLFGKMTHGFVCFCDQ